MGKKNYVLDTNILLESPNAIFGFDDNNVILTGTTVQELDNKKTAPGDIGFCAREAGRIIEELRKRGNIMEGVPLDNGGTFMVCHDERVKLPSGFMFDKADNRIISTTIFVTEHNQEKTILVTNDNMMRINATICGIQYVEFYKNDHITSDKEYFGWDVYHTTAECIDQLYADKVLKLDFKFEENEFLHITDDDKKNALAIVKDGKAVLIYTDKLHPMGITPKNISQKFALYALLAPVEEIPFVILKGPAGCAKTFLSLATGLDQAYESTFKREKGSGYKRVFISRNNVMSDADFGYLPGDLEEKMNPLMAPFMDNLENLLINKCKNEDSREIQKQIDDLFLSGVINVCPMAYMRGRSITDTYLIVDEAQNATRSQIRDVITRAGEGTKIVICGDPDQIDKHTLDRWNNGLVYAADKMKGSKLCAQLTMDTKDCVRSKLAKEAISRLSL